jgi:hypothetical protein
MIVIDVCALGPNVAIGEDFVHLKMSVNLSLNLWLKLMLRL